MDGQKAEWKNCTEEGLVSVRETKGKNEVESTEPRKLHFMDKDEGSLTKTQSMHQKEFIWIKISCLLVDSSPTLFFMILRHYWMWFTLSPFGLFYLFTRRKKKKKMNDR